MSSSKTSNYNLNQWVKSDRVLMSEFNADNAKIDAALKAQNTAIAGKASTSALNSLTTTVNGLKTSKADKSTVDSLSATVTQHTTSLSQKGNCQITVTPYTGNGQDTRTHTFPRKPVMFFITGSAVMVVGYGSSYTNNDAGGHGVNVAWSGNSATLSSNSATTSDDPRVIGNINGTQYQIIALYDQEA